MDAKEFLSMYNQAENSKQDEQIKKLKQEIKDLKESKDIIQEEKTGYKAILEEKNKLIKQLKDENEEQKEKLEYFEERWMFNYVLSRMMLLLIFVFIITTILKFCKIVQLF